MTASDKSLKAMIDAAMERRYSGNPGERFFTGGVLILSSTLKAGKIARWRQLLKPSRFN